MYYAKQFYIKYIYVNVIPRDRVIVHAPTIFVRQQDNPLFIRGAEIMNKANSLIMAGIVALSLPLTASAATHTYTGYLTDAEGGIVKDGMGGCWHTRDWTPAMAVAGCDPVAAVSEVKTPRPAAKIADTPAPKPMPVVAKTEPPKAMPQKVSISDEDLFKFNKAVLNPKGRAVLDKLVQELNGVKYDVIHVTGYTDRLGGARYNKKLSLRRARVVMNYLEKHGIPADRIEAEGMGKTHPITRYADCRGMSKAKTIVCLQPDRRTEIAVVGTKQATNQKLSSLSRR
jgi:OOP family OmpA-OmpF porin